MTHSRPLCDCHDEPRVLALVRDWWGELMAIFNDRGPVLVDCGTCPPMLETHPHPYRDPKCEESG